MSKGKKIAGILLILLGIIAIVSVFVVPAVNRKNNDKAIEEIRAGSEPAVENTQEAVSAPGAGTATDTAVEPATVDERQKRMEEILADGTRKRI